MLLEDRVRGSFFVGLADLFCHAIVAHLTQYFTVDMIRMRRRSGVRQK